MLQSARLFGPGIPVTGVSVTLQVDPNAVVIDSHRLRLPDSGVALRHIGLDGGGIELGWNNAAGQWAVQVLEAESAQRLMAYPAVRRAADIAGFERLSRKQRRWRRLGWSALLGLIAVTMVAVGVLMANADRLAEWIVQKVSLEQERAMGEASFAQIRPQLQLVDETEAARIVQQIGARLTEGSRQHYVFHVAKEAQVNAYALPGGIVVVNSGLIAATRKPEELAGVLAHEVQHVELRHGLRTLVKQAGLGAVWAFVTGDLGRSLAGQISQQLVGLKFSRDAEREADEKGLAALVRAGIDPAGMPAFFGRLAEQGDLAASILSTHPASKERQEELGARVAEIAARQNAAIRPLQYKAWPPAL